MKDQTFEIKIGDLLNQVTVDEIVFENMTFVQFIILVGFFIKFSNFADKIIFLQYYH